jgi:hypothetical protein
VRHPSSALGPLVLALLHAGSRVHAPIARARSGRRGSPPRSGPRWPLVALGGKRDNHGARGRMVATILIVLWLFFGFFFEYFVIWVCQFGLLAWALTGIWAKGWAVPSTPRAPRIELTADERRSLVPRYSDWRNASHQTKGLMIGAVILIAAFGVAWSSGDARRQQIMALSLTISIGVPVMYRMLKPL